MAGDYTLVSKNKHGECTVALKLKVKGQYFFNCTPQFY